MMRFPKSFAIFRRINPTLTSQHLRHLSSLPSHQVVAMPALSPTMEFGTIIKWTSNAGDKISPGDSLAEVETDKAVMAFEAQDEFFVAKLLVEPGVEVKVGDPILVTVEDADAVAAFANFTAPKAPVPAAAAPSIPATKHAVVEAPPAPKPAAPVAPSPTTQQAAPTVAKAAPAAAAAPPKKATASTATFVFGSGVLKGALANKLAAEQKEYIQKYGRGGNLPLKVGK